MLVVVDVETELVSYVDDDVNVVVVAVDEIVDVVVPKRAHPDNESDKNSTITNSEFFFIRFLQVY